MKIFDIAAKDLVRSLRSAFLLVMMFVAPLMITALIYLAFGGLIGSGGALQLPRPSVLIVNLDRPNAGAGLNAGEMLAQQLAGPGMAKVLDAQVVASEGAARQAVDRHQADVAVIIPSGFTQAIEQPQRQAAVTLYHHPDSAIGVRVVKVMVSDFVDGFAGAKIAVHTASHQLEAQGFTLPSAGAEAIARAYGAWAQQSADWGQAGAPGTQQTVALAPRAPAAADGAARGAAAATLFLGPVMAGMMVFFMFFTGAAAAQSIVYEEQDGTLARLFTTPTPRWMILSGKMLAVVITLALQAVVLLIASALVFHIQWGQLPSVVLLTTMVVLAASGFGILLISFVRSTRQAGPVVGLVVTLTGLMAGLMPTGDPSQPPPFETLTLALPQGWAQHGWRMVLAGAGPAEIWSPLLVLAMSGAALFFLATLVFRRRFA